MFGKKDYHTNMEQQLRQLGAKIDELVAKSSQATADAKVEYAKQAKNLREKQEIAQKKLKEISEASEEAWEGIKHGSDKAWTELKGAWETARSKFK